MTDIGMAEALQELAKLRAEVSALRSALGRCLETAAECRRYLTCEGMDVPSYRTYRQVWDASRDAEIQALELLGDPFTQEFQLCDDDGIVRRGAMHHGTDYPCTGHAHFGGEHIRCTNQRHQAGSPFPGVPFVGGD